MPGLCSVIDTHDMRVDFGKYKGERYTRLPISYLRWMIDIDHRCKEVAQAELDRRGIKANDHNIEISGHAIDSASLRCRKIWHKDKQKDEGLHAWLLRVCEEAITTLEPDSDDRINYKGMRLVFNRGNLYWTLKTVMRENRK